MARTNATCPAFNGVPLASASSRAVSTATAAMVNPPVQPAASTRRCSAASTRREVCQVARATWYTEVPSTRRNAAGSVTGSAGPCRGIEARVRAAWVSRATVWLICRVGRPAARTTRSASARTCQSCQRARDPSRVPMMAADWCCTQLRVTRTGRRGRRRVRVRRSIVSMPPGPNTVSASARHAARCWARVRGACLDWRVSRVACCANERASMMVGGRPWSRWNAAASSPWRCSIETLRADQCRFNAGSTPTISRTGRLPGSGSARSVNRSPSRSPRWASRAVLYTSEAVTLALNSSRPSIANQRPSRVCTLLATATWVCRSGSPARESRWVNAAAIRPRTLTWRTPLVPVRVNRAWVSRNRNASLIAARWACSIWAATAGSANAHSVDTLLTGEKVRSNPATAVVCGRDSFAMWPANSRASSGSRPCSVRNDSRPSWERSSARTSRGTGQSPGRPRDWL